MLLLQCRGEPRSPAGEHGSPLQTIHIFHHIKSYVIDKRFHQSSAHIIGLEINRLFVLSRTDFTIVSIGVH